MFIFLWDPPATWVCLFFKGVSSKDLCYVSIENQVEGLECVEPGTRAPNSASRIENVIAVPLLLRSVIFVLVSRNYMIRWKPKSVDPKFQFLLYFRLNY